MTQAATERYAKATPKQREVAQNFYEVVEAYTAGDLTLEQAHNLTGDGWLRASVMRITAPDHPQYQNAMKFFDDLIAWREPDLIKTKHGWFSENDLTEEHGRMVRVLNEDTGEIRDVLQWSPGVNKATEERIWPNRDQIVQRETEQAKSYESPFRADWYDENDDDKGDDNLTS